MISWMDVVWVRGAAALSVVLAMGCHGKETDEVIAGLRRDNTHLKARVRALEAENAVLSQPTERLRATTVSLARVGGAKGRLAYHRECPAGEALKGFVGRAGSVVDALMPVCAPVAPVRGAVRGMVFERELPFVGGPGGRSADSLCPGDALMTGLSGRAAAVVDALEVTCQSDRRGGRIGGSGGQDYQRSCPQGWLAVGIAGRYSGYVESVSVICAPLESDARRDPRSFELRKAPTLRLDHALPDPTDPKTTPETP